MQFSAIIRFIVKTYLKSAFTNDLKRKCFFFRKMFIVADLVSLIDITHIYKICDKVDQKFKFLCKPIGCEEQEGAE